MRRKKLCALLCAAALTLSAVGGMPAAAEASTETEGTTTEEPEVAKLPAPTNVYVDENEVIHWDAVEGATGYTVQLENKEGKTLTVNTETNYTDDLKSKLTIWGWSPIYSKDHALSVSVSAKSGTLKGEASEPVAFTYSLDTWKANFKYDEETGRLSWDNWTDDVSNGNLSYYVWGIPHDLLYSMPYFTATTDSGYWNPALSGYDPARVFLPLEFAELSLSLPDTDFRGDYTIWLTSSALGSAHEWFTDRIGDYESSDTFTYHYDGCDINPALKPPKDNLWQGGGWTDVTNNVSVAWDPVDGAVGYIVHFTCEAGKSADRYTFAYSNSINHSVYSGVDGAWCLEICSVDKNGDRSEWSEPLWFTVKDGKVVDGLYYAYLNNIDSEGNLILTEAEGAVRYTVGVTGNGADLSFESETPVIEGFSEALKSYPAGKYTLVISTYNSGWTCRWYVTSFNKEDEGFFNEENETGTAVESAPEAAEIPESDKIPAVAINPAFNLVKKGETDVIIDISNIKIKAKEIYDEEGLKRAEEALGEEIIGNKHYNLLDLTLWEGNTDISNGYDGLVKVIIPLPTGHLDKTFHVYRFVDKDGKWGYEEIPGEQTEDSYIIYLEHFSEYALVADGGETPETPEKQGFYSDGKTITEAALGEIVTQKTAVKDGKQDVRFIQKVNGSDLSGKSKAVFTLTSSETGKTPQKVSTDKYYTGLTFDDGTKAAAASGQVFLCYTVKDVPEGVTVEATAVNLE